MVCEREKDEGLFLKLSKIAAELTQERERGRERKEKTEVESYLGKSEKRKCERENCR